MLWAYAIRPYGCGCGVQMLSLLPIDGRGAMLAPSMLAPSMLAPSIIVLTLHLQVVTYHHFWLSLDTPSQQLRRNFEPTATTRDEDSAAQPKAV